MSVKKKKEKPSGDVELLVLQVRRLANELDGVGAKLRAVALTAEELKLLLGELRAVRYLLDSKREFRHLDRQGVPFLSDPLAFSARCIRCGAGLSSDKESHCPRCKSAAAGVVAP